MRGLRFRGDDVLGVVELVVAVEGDPAAASGGRREGVVRAEGLLFERPDSFFFLVGGLSVVTLVVAGL